MKRELLQFSLFTLVAASIMAGCLLGANLVGRGYLKKEYLNPDVFRVYQSAQKYGWPCDAVFREPAWPPPPGLDLQKTVRFYWGFIHIEYSRLFVNIGASLIVLLAGVYAIEWLVRIREGRVMIGRFKVLKVLLVALALAIACANLRRPLPLEMGTCWGWPQAFLQVSRDGRAVLFSVFALLANVVFAFAAIGIAARLGAWMFGLEMAIQPKRPHDSAVC